MKEYIEQLNLAIERTLKMGWPVPTEKQIQYLANLMAQKGGSPSKHGLGFNSKQYLSKLIFKELLSKVEALHYLK